MSRYQARSVVAVVAAFLMAGASVAPAAIAADAEVASDRDVAALVDPFVGTHSDYGNDMPAAQAPHGLAKVNPRTGSHRNHTGYDYRATTIEGFTHTNLDGVGGGGGGGDILVVPTSGSFTTRPAANTYARPFDKVSEEASPAYYGVTMRNTAGTDNGISTAAGSIDAEVTATTRSGLHRYQFPAGAEPSLVVDLRNNTGSRIASSISVETLEDGRAALSGRFVGHFYNAPYELYYYATTEQAVTGIDTWGGPGAFGGTASRSGTDTGAVLKFSAADADEIGLRVTLSPISADQARIDQQVELGELTFDEIHDRSYQEWNDKLSRVEVDASTSTDPTGETEQLFYTHLYRMFGMPVNATSTSGTYRGIDGVVHRAEGFTYYDGWATWDDFRKYSVIAYVDPQAYADMMQSKVYFFADWASEPTGRGLGSLTHSAPTVRWERSSVVIADAIAKGFTQLDRLDEAYPALERLVGGYSAADRERGYLPNDPANALQLGYDQWGLAVIADALGKDEAAADLFEQAALAPANNIRPGAWTAPDGTQVGHLTPRNADGSWAPINPEAFEAARMYQGTAWQWNWYTSYDMEALIEAMGGEHAALMAMRHMFGEDAPDDGSAMLQSNANEVDLQMAYLFNYVGAPSLTQKWSRAIHTKETWNRYIAAGSTSLAPSSGGEFRPPIKTKVFKLAPEGMLPTMDNDAGTMSTMFVAAALGLFPVTSGTGEFQIGSPFFDSAVISYDDGRTFTIEANGVSEDAFYVQSAALNGRGFDNTWVDYQTLMAGGSLSFQMGENPSDWGADTARPYSMSTAADAEPAQYSVTAEPSSISAGTDGEVDGTVRLTVHGGATFAASTGTDLTASGAAVVSGLPSSVTATVAVASSTAIDVILRGTVERDARFYLSLSDEAFAGDVRASEVRGPGLSLGSSLLVSVIAADRETLQQLLEDADLVRQGNYSLQSYRALDAARDRARTALADDNASSTTLRFATDALRAAIDGLVLDQGGFRRLEAELSDSWSGGELKNESNQSSGNLGGVRNNSWIQYEGVTFDEDLPEYLTTRYDTSFGPNDTPSWIEVRAGDAEGSQVARVELVGTSGWGNYREVVTIVDDPAALAEAETVTFVFRMPSGRNWVGNFDWFQFSAEDPAGVTTPTTGFVLEAEDWVSHSGGDLKNEGSTWNTGAVTNIGGTYDGAWLAYGEVDFGTTSLGEVSAHYVHNSSRCGRDSAIDVYLDEFDPADPGEPFVTIDLPNTGSNWTTAGRSTAALPQLVSGTHEVFLRLRTDAFDSNPPFVANIDSLEFMPGGPDEVTVEAEDWVSHSGGELKNESSNWSSGPVVNVGGIRNDSWLSYGEIDFGSGELDEVTAHYVHNSARSGDDSAIDVHLGDFDPADPGTPFVTIPLPNTGSNWSTDGRSTVSLPSGLRGVHEVTLRLRTTEQPNRPFVANINNLMFFTEVDDEVEVDTDALEAAIARFAPLEAQADRFPRIDFERFIAELNGARSMLSAGTVTQAEVNAQTRSLTQAAEQLVPVERRRLENLVAQVAELSDVGYTSESWESLQAALARAESVLDDESASDDALRQARAELEDAVSDLELEPVVPGAPQDVVAIVSATSVTVNWTAPVDDGGSPVIAYVVELDSGQRIRISDPGQTSAVFTWLKPGDAYRARVTAITDAGASEPSPFTAAVVAGESTGGTSGPTSTDPTDASLRSIDVAGVVIDGFDPAILTYVVDWPEAVALPTVGATTSVEDASVSLREDLLRVEMIGGGGSGALGMARAVVTGALQVGISVTSADGGSSQEYTLLFHLTAGNHLPSGVNAGAPGGGDGDGSGGTDDGGGTDGSTGGGTGGAGVEDGLSSTGPVGIAITVFVALSLVFVGVGVILRRSILGRSDEAVGTM